MVTANRGLSPSVHLHVGDEVYDARPVLLLGHRASLVLDGMPSRRGDVRLVLGWADGSRTELSGRLRAVEAGGVVAHLDLSAVQGDWRPFLEYLGVRSSLR